jgi:hypothetical protein
MPLAKNRPPQTTRVHCAEIHGKEQAHRQSYHMTTLANPNSMQSTSSLPFLHIISPYYDAVESIRPSKYTIISNCINSRHLHYMIIRQNLYSRLMLSQLEREGFFFYRSLWYQIRSNTSNALTSMFSILSDASNVDQNLLGLV